MTSSHVTCVSRSVRWRGWKRLLTNSVKATQRQVLEEVLEEEMVIGAIVAMVAMVAMVVMVVVTVGWVL